MSRLGPVITLAAGAVLAAGLGVASITATPAADTTTATADDNPAAEGSAAEENTAQPSPSPTESEEKRIEKADYAGRVKGNGALIAISIRDGKAIGYFCDGRTESWFKGSQSADEVSLKGLAAGKVTAELGGGRAKGWVSVGGKKWSFVAPTVEKPSGLYRASAIVRGAQFKAGWIRVKNPNGGYTTVGAASEGGSPVPVPELNGEQPTAPLTVGDTTIYPKDVDSFIEEMQ
ncbi:hypothetical protein ACTWPT_16580 [Nonomuraea sp. 3N208]|uniref:hypothetical protein n=1 Tax=Nonomuraea sp. 3N208 TaxID=3457421 RepID=UPI003FCEDBBC